MASETRAPSTVSGPEVTSRRSLKHLAHRSPLAALVALLISVVVSRLVLLGAPSNSTGKATAKKGQLLRFPQARPPAFSARLHYQHGAVQHLFAHAVQDLQPLWEPGKPIADIEIPPAGVLTFRRRNESSGRLAAANASSFCLTGPQACTDWSRVGLDVSLEVALQHLRESDPASEASVCLPAPLDDSSVPDESVTLVTQLSVSRLPRFDRLLNAWDGPISATIYLVDEHQDLATLDSYLRELFSSSPSRRQSWSRLTLTILKPSYAPDRASVLERLRYPINRLRNLAIQASSSTYILVIDVDFVPSPDMHRLLVRGAIPLIETTSRRRRSPSSPTLRRTAVVIPTFALAVGFEGEIPRTLQEVERLYRAEPQLAMLTDPNAGHGPTLPSGLFHHQLREHSRKNSNSSTSSYADFSSYSYEVCYEPQWEPYYVLHRASHPLYDERFTDQGGDKQSHALVLNALGYEFRVLTTAVWVVHPPKKDLASEAWPAARRAGEEADLRVDAAGEASPGGGGEGVNKSEPPSPPPLTPESDEHFNLAAQRDQTRFRYFQDFLPEMETAWGKRTLRWPRGCSAGVLASGRWFGRARPPSAFGL